MSRTLPVSSRTEGAWRRALSVLGVVVALAGGMALAPAVAQVVPEQHFKWRVPLPGPYSLVRPAVGADGTVYAVDVGNHLLAVGPDGDVLWQVDDAGSKGLALGPDGTIYTGNETWIKAFRPDGSLKWTFVQEPRAFVLVAVAVGADGHIYAVASSGMGVFSLADLGDSAQLRWNMPEVYSRPFVGYGEIEFGPTQDGAELQLYFFANGHARALRLSDGAPVFTLGGGNTPPRVSPRFGSWHLPSEARSPDGALLWRFEFPLASGTTEPVLGQSGTHYAVNSGNTLYSIAPDGTEQWRAPLGEFVGLPDVDPAESAVLLAAGGTATHPAAIKAVHTGDGRALWRMEFPAVGAGQEQFIDSRFAYSPGGDAAYMVTSVAVSGVSFLNAVATDPALPSASTVLRSTEIALSARSRPRAVRVTGRVTVQDENLAPLAGVTVDVRWTLPDGRHVDQRSTTDAGGMAQFKQKNGGGEYVLSVTGLAKGGYQFDPDHSLLQASKFWN